MGNYPSVYALLKKYRIRPKQRLGQNFLADENHLQKIIAAADLSATASVLEIGPGLGTLSVLLAAQTKQVAAVELDPTMVNILQTELAHVPNFRVEQADILAIDPAAVLHLSKDQPYHIVANLPYYITSAIIQHLLEAPHPPQTIVITVQKEVAQRIIAEPGQMSILAISVQFYGRPTLCHTIPASAFVPSPKVDSAVLRIDRYPTLAVDVTDTATFFRVVKAGFSQRRKQLKNSLAAGLHRPQADIVARMESAGINPSQRAQTLTLAEWAALAAAFQR